MQNEKYRLTYYEISTRVYMKLLISFSGQYPIPYLLPFGAVLFLDCSSMQQRKRSMGFEKVSGRQQKSEAPPYSFSP
jgi:hypothetical protein